MKVEIGYNDVRPGPGIKAVNVWDYGFGYYICVQPARRIAGHVVLTSELGWMTYCARCSVYDAYRCYTDVYFIPEGEREGSIVKGAVAMLAHSPAPSFLLIPRENIPQGHMLDKSLVVEWVAEKELE